MYDDQTVIIAAWEYWQENVMNICDVLHDLVPFEQFKKREKHPSTSVTFGKIAGFSLQLY